MADAVRFHHEAAEAMFDADVLTRTVWAAHQAATIATYPTPEIEGFNAVAQQLGLQPMALARVCATAQSNVLQLAAALAVPNAQTTLPAWRPLATPHAPPPASGDLHQTLAAMAALQPLHSQLAAADSELGWLVVARESIRILCGLQDVVFLLAEANSPRLRGRPLPGQVPLLSQFQVSTAARANDAVSRAAQSLAICTSFDDPPGPGTGLRDRQLAGVLGSEGLLCVPMAQGQALWGVMVCPVSRASAEPLRRRRALLETLGSTLAELWQAWHAAERQAKDRQAAANDQWLLREREVAHEVNNPLSVIKTYLQMVEGKLPAALGLEGELQVVHEEIDRVARIVHELGRRPDLEAQPLQAGSCIDLNQELEGLNLLYRPALFQTTGIESILQLQRPLALTQAGSDAVRQVLLNLWKNAAEALPAGSRIVTGTADHVHLQGRIYTQLSVVDNGPGLPEDVKLKLFQPLGLQRRPGHSGLGLSIVGQLVAQLGGRISCQSTQGRGTAFTILLPQQEAPSNPSVSP
jgi:signal transduction histidine kinase